MMGLDIAAYSNLNPVGKHAEGGWCERDESHVVAFAYDAFPRSFRGVPVLHTDGGTIWGGCYEQTGDTKTHHFRAGSYGGYNRWREDLQEQFNPERFDDRPFYELIWFADNEGTIGPDAAVDLLADFRTHRAQYVDAHQGVRGDYYVERYDDWTKAFGLAAGSGLVVFR